MRCTSRVMAALIAGGMAGGCSDPAAVDTEAAVRLEIAGGDGQEAVSHAYGYVPIGQGAMPESLRVRVTNLAGEPLAGRTVTWLVTWGGSVSPTTSVTDASGHAATKWWLYLPPPSGAATAAGEHTVRAAIAGGPVVDFKGHVRTGIRVDDIWFTPDTVTVGSTPASVTVSVRVQDDRRTTSLSHGAVQLYNPSATAEAYQSAYGTLALASGTPNDGVWSVTVDVPAGAEPGAWYLGRLVLGWGCGGWNRMELIEPTLTTTGLARTLQVRGTSAAVAGGTASARAPLALPAPAGLVAAAGC